ncbi:MAG: hypothetical protein ABH851_09490 [Methanobacteriota archaeon]
MKKTVFVLAVSLVLGFLTMIVVTELLQDKVFFSLFIGISVGVLTILATFIICKKTL